METRTFALTSILLAFTLAACPAIERFAMDTSRMQAAGSGAGDDPVPMPGPAASPPATATPNVTAAMLDESDAGLEPAPMPDESDAGLGPSLMSDEVDAGLEPSPIPDEVDAGLDPGLTCRGQIVGDCAECLQDDAFCEPLPDGRWCTGSSASECPAGSKPVASGQACAPGHICWQESESLHCASEQPILP